MSTQALNPIAETFWYAKREQIAAVAGFLVLLGLMVGFIKPVAERIVRSTTEAIQIEVSEPPVETPTPPAPLVSATPPATTPPPNKPQLPQPSPEPKATNPQPTTPQATSIRPTGDVPPQEPARASGEPTHTPAVAPQPVAEVPKAAPPTPAPAKPVSAAAAAVQNDHYEAQVLRYLETVKRYPTSREAREKRPVGTVVVWVEINRAGKVLAAGVEKSSDSSILDREALRLVSSSTFPPFPENAFVGADKHRFSANLFYELKNAD